MRFVLVCVSASMFCARICVSCLRLSPVLVIASASVSVCASPSLLGPEVQGNQIRPSRLVLGDAHFEM